MLNKTQSSENFVYLVGLHVYYKMIHGPYNTKFTLIIWLVDVTVVISRRVFKISMPEFWP